MVNWKNALIGPDASIRETIVRIDDGAIQIALVVDERGRLLGTITDGDIRRGILRGVTLEDKAKAVMNASPTTAPRNAPRDDILALMRHKQLNQIPILDERGEVVDVEVLSGAIQSSPKENEVIVMAGGLGSRLQPLTNDTPKPMLQVGDKPMLETILERFVDYGFRRFYFSLNYKAEMIKRYFAGGDAWGVSIRYLEETQPLGTAGSLSLLPQIPAHPVIVMNGDVLTKVNFHHLLDFHVAHRAPATMCVGKYDIQVPYGVVGLDHHVITAIDEKPTHLFVNAGIYVLEPDALRHVPKNTFFDMPMLFKSLITEGKTPAAFPLFEYWLDIGKLDDYERAHGDYPGNFRDQR